MKAAETLTISDELAELLRCPECGLELDGRGDSMVCAEGHTYPLVRGLPRLFDEARISLDQRATSEAFGYSWENYRPENPYTESQWRDWIMPLDERDFRDKLVLDAGCGLCGFAEYARRWGARQVVGADLSSAVDAARQRVAGSVDLVQADLHRLPFAPRTFDIAYSIGVLHHLPDPEKGFRAVAGMVREGGLMFAWVYGRENNGWIVRLVDPLRRHVFKRLPPWLVKWGISLPLAALLWPLVKLAGVVNAIPYGEYLRWLGQRDFGFLHGVVFDHLIAPTSHYVRRAEFENWFKRAGLVDVRISWRNRNSWRGVGRVPLAHPEADR